MSNQEKTAPEALVEHPTPAAVEQHHEEFVKPGADVDLPITSAYAGWSRTKTMKKFWRLFVTGVIVAVAAMYIGYANSVIGSVIANKGFIRQFATVIDRETGEPALDAMHISLWSAIWNITQIFVQIASPMIADKWGRKINMWIFTLFLCLSIIIACVSTDWTHLVGSRVCAGVASGLISTSIMTYLSEIAMPQFRGTLLSAFSFFFALGQAFLAIGLKILNDTNPMAFRNLFYSEFVFAGLWMFPMIFLPESPAWLAGQGRHDEAKKALLRLVGTVDGYDVELEYAVIRDEVEKSREAQNAGNENSWKAMLRPINMKRTVIAALPFSYQNFVGVPLIFGYTTYFFQLAKMKDPFLGNMIIQLILLVGIICSLYWVDRAGRRILCIGGGFSMGVITFIIGGLGWVEDTAASGAALISLCSIWVFIYANSLAPIGWVSLVEVSTPHLRAKTAAIASCIQSLSGVLFSYTVPFLLSNQGANLREKTGLFFGGLSWLYLIPVIFLFPEVKGRTYQEIDELFERRIKPWNFAKTKTAYEAGLEVRQENAEAAP